MKPLPKILEGIENGLETHVKFSNGDCFGLVDFEMVDESIYERSDLCVADIESKIEVKSEAYSIGNKLEFSVDDVVELKDAASGIVFYQR